MRYLAVLEGGSPMKLTPSSLHSRPLSDVDMGYQMDVSPSAPPRRHNAYTSPAHHHQGREVLIPGMVSSLSEYASHQGRFVEDMVSAESSLSSMER